MVLSIKIREQKIKMNRYWGGLLATALIALYGLYMLYKAFRGETILIYNVIELSPKLLVVGALLAGFLFIAYVCFGIYMGAF